LTELKGTGHQFALKAMKKAEVYEVSAPFAQFLVSLKDALRHFMLIILLSALKNWVNDLMCRLNYVLV
jgi:hypothetical protein